MTEFSKNHNPDTPQDEPAIVLSGEAIRSMSPERRQEIAESLGALIGAHAEVIYTPIEQPEGSETPAKQPFEEREHDEDDEIIPPFSVVLRHPKNWGHPAAGVAKLIRTVTRQHPGSLQDESMTKRAVAAVAVAGGRASQLDTELHTYFGFHYDEKPDTYNYRPVAAVTFKDPSAFIDNPAEIHELVRNLGPKGIEALAELALTITNTAKPQHREA